MPDDSVRARSVSPVAFRDVPALPEDDLATMPPRPTRVEPVALPDLAELAGAAVLRRCLTAVTVTGVTLRAQHVRAGDLFAALPGARAHGADFAAAAVASGAAAVLTDPAGAAPSGAGRACRCWCTTTREPCSARWRPGLRRPVAPSRGARRDRHVGQDDDHDHGGRRPGGRRDQGRPDRHDGTRIAGERVPSALTTPEAPDLQALLAVMVEQGVTHVPMEVSSHALTLGRVAGIRFAVGAFTNLSQDHLDFHPDMEDYFAAKAKLFDGRSRTEVVCTDTDVGHGGWSGRARSRCPRCTPRRGCAAGPPWTSTPS